MKLNNFWKKQENKLELFSLKDICDIQPPKKEARELLSKDSLVSFLPMEDLECYSTYVLPRLHRKLSEVVKGYTYFKEGDLLLAKITPCFENGKMGIAKGLKNGIGFGSTEYIVLRCGDKILPEWLFRFLSLPFVREEGRELMTGAVGHKRIPKDYIQELKIPVPNIEDQKILLKKLESKIDEINECESRLEQQIQLLKDLEKSLTYETLGLKQYE